MPGMRASKPPCAAFYAAWLSACSGVQPPPHARSNEPPRARSADARPGGEPKAPPNVESSVRLGELEERIEGLLPATERWRLRLTPVLPCSWPAADHCVKLLAYESSPLPTGTIQFRYRGPVSIIRCSLLPVQCSLARFDGEQDELVEIDGSHASVPDGEAQQRLLDLVQRGQLPEHPPEQLASYARWLGEHGGLGASVRSRVPELFAWLGREPRPLHER